MTTTRPRGAALLGLLLALVLPVVAAGPAAADVETKRDPRGDVTEFRARQQEPRPSADVLQLTSRHADGRVALQVVLTDLDTTSQVGTTFAVRTPTDRVFIPSVQRTEDGETDVRLFDTSFDEVPCPGLRGAVLPAADRTTVSVPRQCLNRPRWVQTGAVSFAIVDPFELAYGDDARRDGQARSPFPFIGTKRLFLD